MAPKLGPHAANMAGSTSRLSYDAACVMLIGVSNQIELSEVATAHPELGAGVL